MVLYPVYSYMRSIQWTNCIICFLGRTVLLPDYSYSRSSYIRFPVYRISCLEIAWKTGVTGLVRLCMDDVSTKPSPFVLRVSIPIVLPIIMRLPSNSEVGGKSFTEPPPSQYRSLACLHGGASSAHFIWGELWKGNWITVARPTS